MNELILSLRDINPLTLKELSNLLNRKPDSITRMYLSGLVKEGRLELF